jgi:hypothetical protein
MVDKKESIDIKMARMDEKIGFVLTELKSLKDGTYTDIADLKKNKADNKEIDRLQGIINEVQNKINGDILVKVSSLESTRQDFRDKLANEAAQCKQRSDGLKGYLIFASAIVIMGVGILLAIKTGITLPH